MSNSQKPPRKPTGAKSSQPVDLYTSPDEQRAFDALKLKLEKLAGAGKPAPEDGLKLVTDFLRRQRQDVLSKVQAPQIVREALYFFVEDLLEDLQKFPSENQLFKSVAVASYIEILILNYSIRRVGDERWATRDP
jgi:hypothetical protein